MPIAQARKQVEIVEQWQVYSHSPLPVRRTSLATASCPATNFKCSFFCKIMRVTDKMTYDSVPRMLVAKKETQQENTL